MNRLSISKTDPFAGGTARPRIAIYEPSAGPSGPSRYVHSLLNHLDPAEFEVCIFCHETGPYAPSDTLRIERRNESSNPEAAATAGEANRPGANAPRSSSPGGWKALVPRSVTLWNGFTRETRSLARVFCRWPADLLHSQQTGCEEAPVAARLAGVPRVVGTFHVDPMYDLEQQRSGFRHRVLETISNHALHKCIAISDAVKRMWTQRTFLSASRVVTIHNGIDPEKFCRRRSQDEARRMLGLPNDGRLLIGGVGRLDDAKGFCYLIEALELLAGSHPRASVVIAGRGIRREELERQVQRAGLRDRVFLLGHCPEIQVFYDAVDLLAAPSLCESLSYAVQEAMSHELPVVGSRVGGIPELVLPGETGFLVAARSGSELAAALIPLLESSELRCRMGRAGRDRIVSHFTEKEMARRTLELYRQTLAVGIAPSNVGRLLANTH